MPENVPLIGSRVVRTLLLFAIIALIGQSFSWLGGISDRRSRRLHNHHRMEPLVSAGSGAFLV